MRDISQKGDRDSLGMGAGRLGLRGGWGGGGHIFGEWDGMGSLFVVGTGGHSRSGGVYLH